MSQSQLLEKGKETIEQDRELFEELANTDLRCSQYAELLLEVTAE